MLRSLASGESYDGCSCGGRLTPATRACVTRAGRDARRLPTSMSAALLDGSRAWDGRPRLAVHRRSVPCDVVTERSYVSRCVRSDEDAGRQEGTALEARWFLRQPAHIPQAVTRSRTDAAVGVLRRSRQCQPCECEVSHAFGRPSLRSTAPDDVTLSTGHV
jgi:hypothetical protein